MNSSIENKNLINSNLEESNNSQNQNMNIDEIQDLLEKTEQENTKDKIEEFIFRLKFRKYSKRNSRYDKKNIK